MVLLSGLAIWQSFAMLKWPQTWLSLIEFAPYAMIFVAAFISIWLNRMQPLLILLSLLALHTLFTLFNLSEPTSIGQTLMLALLSFLVPLNILIWLLLPERGVQHLGYNFFIAGLLGAQALTVYWLMTELPLAWLEWLTLPVVAGQQVYHLSFAASLMFLLAGFVISLQLYLQSSLRVFTHVCLFAVLLSAFAINQSMQPGLLAWMLTVVAFMVLLALIFDAHHIAYTDELTGLRGRRALMESFMGLGKRYSLAMVDIDHFKQFNDTYGHDVGDKVLKMVAHTLDTVQGGKAYRYGGEEFTLLFPRKTPEQVLAELDRLRLAVAHQLVTIDNKDKKSKKAPKTVNVHISMGVAEPDAEHQTAQQVMKFADEGLYRAKRTGRNRVVVSKAKAAKATKAKAAKSKA